MFKTSPRPRPRELAQPGTEVFVVLEDDQGSADFPCVIMGVYNNPGEAWALADKLEREEYGHHANDPDRDRDDDDKSWHVEGRTVGGEEGRTVMPDERWRR